MKSLWIIQLNQTSIQNWYLLNTMLSPGQLWMLSCLYILQLLESVCGNLSHEYAQYSLSLCTTSVLIMFKSNHCDFYVVLSDNCLKQIHPYWVSIYAHAMTLINFELVILPITNRFLMLQLTQYIGSIDAPPYINFIIYFVYNAGLPVFCWDIYFWKRLQIIKLLKNVIKFKNVFHTVIYIMAFGNLSHEYAQHSIL